MTVDSLTKMTHQDLVMKTQLLEDLLLYQTELFKDGLTLFRSADNKHLHFAELVDSVQPSVSRP